MLPFQQHPDDFPSLAIKRHWRTVFYGVDERSQVEGQRDGDRRVGEAPAAHQDCMPDAGMISAGG